MDSQNGGYRLKTLLFVAIISIIAGVAVTARFDLTNLTGAQSFWKEPAPGAQGQAAQPKTEAQQFNAPNFVDLAKRLSPSVVNISTTQTTKERPLMPFPEFKGPFDEFFGDDLNKFFTEPNREQKRQSLGSGFIINKDGYILTNFHVIENATEIIVTFSEDKKEHKARIVGQDQKLDIALIKINAGDDLPAVPLGDSDALQIGEWVMAIGNPFGLGGTITAGIVSQKGRVIGAGPYDNFIQTDASINPGNSGGPLFNIKGEVVGINTAIIAGGQGIGFATPINMVKGILVQLKERGRITRGWIGVGIQELTPDLAKTFGLKDSKGVLISSVSPGDPADKAGIKAGDIIISFDGKPISDLNELPRIVASTAPDKVVSVRIVRDGKEESAFVKIGTKTEEEEFADAQLAEDKEASLDKRIGIGVQPVTPEIVKRFNLPSGDGVLISSVKPDSPAMMAGLKRGDIIKEVDRKPVHNVNEYTKLMRSTEKKDVVLLMIARGNSAIYVAINFKK